MWSAENRARYERRGLRYPSDLTDAEWELVASHIRPAKRGGRPRTANMRAVMNAVLYLLGTGCQWRALPKDFPPRTTVFEYLDLWEWDRTLERVHHALYVAVREQAKREASPTAAIIDSQSVKSATVACLSCKRCESCSRLSSALSPTQAIKGRRRPPPSGHHDAMQIEIVKRSGLHRVVVLPKRWIVERTSAWMGRNGRLSKDYENTTRFATADLRLAMIRLMLRRLIRLSPVL